MLASTLQVSVLLLPKTSRLEEMLTLRVLLHRVRWTPETQNTFKDNDRNDPLDLHITKELLGDGTNEMPGVKKRFGESQENYQRVIDLVGHGKMDEALREAEEYSADGRGHPIFQDAVKDLEGV